MSIETLQLPPKICLTIRCMICWWNRPPRKMFFSWLTMTCGEDFFQYFIHKVDYLSWEGKEEKQKLTFLLKNLWVLFSEVILYFLWIHLPGKYAKPFEFTIRLSKCFFRMPWFAALPLINVLGICAWSCSSRWKLNILQIVDRNLPRCRHLFSKEDSVLGVVILY